MNHAGTQAINSALSNLASSLQSIGPGVKEIRIHVEGEFRVIYIAKYKEGIYILHAFQKKTQKTPKRDIDIAKTRFRELERERKI
jgi:phage-related protein